MDYTKCPACNSPQQRPMRSPVCFTCHACGAVYGGPIPLGDSYVLVKPQFTTDPTADERARYFDFVTVGSAGVGRRHGWYDPSTGLITQTG